MTVISEPGECGILFEADLCYRAWVAGWRVGLVDCYVKGDAGAGVTPGTWWTRGARLKAHARNKALLDSTYRRTDGEAVCGRAQALNETMLLPAPTSVDGAIAPPPRPW